MSEGVGAVEPEPVQPSTREPTGYQYTDGTPICFGDEVKYELPRPLYNILPTIIYGDVIKQFPDCGSEYIYRVDLKGVFSLNSPTLKSIVETANYIKRVVQP